MSQSAGAESDECSNSSALQSEITRPIPRELSFSRWHDSDSASENSCGSLGEECSHLIQKDSYKDECQVRDAHPVKRSLHDNMQLKVSQSLDGLSPSTKHVSFEVEDIFDGELSGEFKDPEQASHLEPGRLDISVAQILKTLLYILIWYTTSTCLTLYNKNLLGEKIGKFPAPLLMNTVHFFMQAVLSKNIVRFSKRLQPDVEMSWRSYFTKVVPTAIGTALDVNLSNASLVFVSVTFATMCKSASPIFLLLFAFAFRLETPSFKLFGIIFIISTGVLLTVAKETNFKLLGFIFVMLASVMSGFRWSMTQILLQKEVHGLRHPIVLMSYVSPVMSLVTGILSILVDPWDEFRRTSYFNNSWHIIHSCLLMIVGGALAFLMVLTEYILVSATSAVTVTIAGVVKEAVTILVAIMYYHEHFTLLKGAGLIIIMIGVSLFNWFRYMKLSTGKMDQNCGRSISSGDAAANYAVLENVDQEIEDGDY